MRPLLHRAAPLALGAVLLVAALLAGLGGAGRVGAFATTAPTVTGTVITAPTTAPAPTAAPVATSSKPASTTQRTSASAPSATRSVAQASVAVTSAAATIAPTTAATTAPTSTTAAPTTLAPATATVPLIAAALPPSTEVATSVVQVGDKASESKINKIWLALVALAIAVAAATIWFWWFTRPVDATLEGLELIGTGRFLKADDGTRSRHLAIVRSRRGTVGEPVLDDVVIEAPAPPLPPPEPGASPA